MVRSKARVVAREEERQRASAGRGCLGEPAQYFVRVLTQRRGSGVRAVPFLAGGFEEAQWWAGQLDRSEHRMLDVDQQALRAGLIPVVDLLQVLDLATGHADGGQLREQVGRRVVGEGLF